MDYRSIQNLEILLGDVYTRLGRYEEAVARLELAANMCPVRFTPLYKLYRVYKVWGREEEARALAWRIFHKEVEISSAEIDEMKAEAGAEIKSC